MSEEVTPIKRKTLVMTGRQRPYPHVELLKQLKRSQRRDNLLASTKQKWNRANTNKRGYGL